MRFDFEFGQTLDYGAACNGYRNNYFILLILIRIVKSNTVLNNMFNHKTRNRSPNNQ